MQHLTYDPILRDQALSRVRLLTPLRPPAPGTALVLAPHQGGLVTIRHGESIPSARHGTYRHMYEVDVSERRLALGVWLPSRDPNFPFRGVVALTCRISDPAEIVRRGIRDVSGALYEPTKRILRQVARHFDIAEFHEAEEAVNASIRGLSGDSAIRLRDVFVEFQLDQDEIARSGREYRNAGRDARLAGMRREDHLSWMRKDGIEGMLAEIMEREGPKAAMEWVVSVETSEREELLTALETIMKHSDGDREPFDTRHAERTVLDRIVGGSAAPFGGTRSGRLRGTLAGRLDAGRPEGSGDRRTMSGRVLDGETAEGHTTGGPPEDEPEGTAHPPDGRDERPAANDGTSGGGSRIRGARVRGTEDGDEGTGGQAG